MVCQIRAACELLTPGNFKTDSLRAQDIFRTINELDDESIQRIIERLEFRGQDPTFRGWLEEYMRKLLLTIPSSARVLVLGCGTGVEVRCLAKQTGFSGHVTGVDHSPSLIEAARRFTVQDGIHERVDFAVGDAHHLEFSDASYDAVIAHTLISHVEDPLTVLKEASRVTAKTGILVVFDGDYASWSFGYKDHVLAKKMEEAIVGSIVNNPRIMRDLPRLLPQAGWIMESHTPHLLSEIGKGSFFLSAAETYGLWPAKHGLLPESSVKIWLAEQQCNHDNGVFFASGNYYTYMARRK